MPEFLHDIPVRPDCRFYRGDLPCRPNKEHGYMCGDCPVYDPAGQRILLIKLDKEKEACALLLHVWAERNPTSHPAGAAVPPAPAI